jgi:hypothetical protein
MRWPPDRHARLGIEERREKQQTHDVVEVQVRQQDVDLLAHAGQSDPQVANARSAVEHEQAAVA